MTRPSLIGLVPAFRDLDLLRDELETKGRAVRDRLEHFRRVGLGSDARLFEELCFCILAIQSSARSSDRAVKALSAEGLLWSGDEASLAEFLQHRTRFHRHKAAYIARARDRFFGSHKPGLKTTLVGFPTSHEARAWLVAEVDGLGFKEASHFLRNIGRGEGLAILDRHILQNLLRHRVIARMPKALTPRRYLAIEGRASKLAQALGVSLGVLDLLLWSRETGEIFK
jgi:N-glycosylase/DNA lyase